MAEQSKRTDPSVPLPDPDLVERSITAAIEKVRERRGYYITIGLLALVAVVAVLILAGKASEPEPSEFTQVWERAMAVRNKLARDSSAREELALLEGLLTELRGQPEEGLTLWLLGIYHYGEARTGDKSTFEQRRPHLEKAAEFLKELQEEEFDELLLAKPGWFTADSQAPVDVLYEQVKADLEWEQKHATSAPAPDDSIVAVLRTAEGDIHLKFFKELAPEHVENFLTLAAAGAYNGTQFHFVRGGNEDPVGIMGGDPYSFFYPRPRTRKHILRWGHGGLGYDIEPEESRFKVLHLRGIVTSQRTENGDWDNAIQFQILLKPDRALDRVHTPFAKVVEGMNVVEKIARKKTASQHPAYRDDNDFASLATSDLLVEPTVIYKVIVFEQGRAREHKFPLREGEESLASLAGTAAAGLPDDQIYAGRELRPIDAEGEIKKGLQVPYPQDVDLSDKKDPPSPKGERAATGK